MPFQGVKERFWRVGNAHKELEHSAFGGRVSGFDAVVDGRCREGESSFERHREELATDVRLRIGGYRADGHDVHQPTYAQPAKRLLDCVHVRRERRFAHPGDGLFRPRRQWYA